MKNNRVSRKDRVKSKRLAPANHLVVYECEQTEPNLRRKVIEYV